MEPTDAPDEGALRYQLARLRARRSIRLAAILSGQVQENRLDELGRVLRGRPPGGAWDSIAPVHRHPPHSLSHIRVLHTTEPAPFGSAATHVRVLPHDQLDESEADLVVVDPGHPGAEQLQRSAEQRGIPTLAPTGIGPLIDPAEDTPIGWRSDADLVAEIGGRRRPHPSETAVAVIERHVPAALGCLARGIVVTGPVVQHLPAPVQRLLEDAPTADELTQDLELRERLSVRLRRLVHERFSAAVVLARVLDELSIPRPSERRISVLLVSMRPDRIRAAIENVLSQRYPQVEPIVVLHGDGFDAADLTTARDLVGDHGRVLTGPQRWPLGACTNLALDHATGDHIAKMDDDDLYGPDHLGDLLLALDYSGATAVGKLAHATYLSREDRTVRGDDERQEQWTHHLPGATMLVRGAELRRVRFQHVPRAIDSMLVRDLHAIGGSCYSTHRFGFVRRRHGSHTFRRSSLRFRWGRTSSDGLDRRLLQT